jgi:hypothetical protein
MPPNVGKQCACEVSLALGAKPPKDITTVFGREKRLISVKEWQP